MCGILGIASNKKLDIKLYNTEAMLKSIRLRGPDGHGEKQYHSCWLGHRRLSIIDLSGGAQPMIDKELTITFNGEIYNYRELREDLEKKGHLFVTNSDTEVILKAYRQYGEDCPQYLDGMFAFGIWDEKKHLLLLARDRFGKKPLYYCFVGETILFASEIKALLASEKVTSRLDYGALDNYLRLMYIPPWKSIYENIFQIGPSHSGIFQNGTLKTKRYWKLEYKNSTANYDEAKQEVRRLLRGAVKKRMLAADVEVGTFLSGGVDSTIVSLLAKDYLDHPIKTFSLGYGEYINELPYAEQAAKKIGSDHFTLQAGGGNDIAELEKIIEYFDEPHADTSDFPQQLVSKLAASKVKVALSGDGADEIFLGYGWHSRYHHLSYRAHTFEKIFLNQFQGRIYSNQIFSTLQRSALWGSPFRLNNDIFDPSAYSQGQSDIQKIGIFDLNTYLPGQLLSKVDRAGMMHSLEVRCPFLDTALVEYVSSLPLEFKINSDGQKAILKDLLCEYMPKDFVYRKKQGFGAPAKKWLREKKMEEYVRSNLGRDAKVRVFFVGKTIDFLVNDFYEKKNDRNTMRLWIILCLEIWLRKNKHRT